MKYVERSTDFNSADLKSYELIGGGKACGRLFGLEISENGIVEGYSCTNLVGNTAPEAAENAYLASDGVLYLYNAGYLHVSTFANGYYFVGGKGFTTAPYYAECNEGDSTYVLISDGNYSVAATMTAIMPFTYQPLRGATVHYNRMFGVDVDDGYKIRWSAAGDVKDWDESLRGAGYVRLNASRGKIYRLIPYNDRLIALREYGLTELRVYGDVENFTVKVTDTDTDSITDGTAAVCYGKLFFFTQSGLYYYNGTTISSFAQEGLEGFKNAVCAAAFANYLFAGGELEGQNVVACINCESGSVSYISQRADCMCSAKRILFYGDDLYEITPAEGAGVWDSGYTDLEVSGKKYLDNIFIDGEAQSITVETNGKTCTLYGVSGKVKIGLCGERFRIKMTCGGGVRAVRAQYATRG